MAITAFVNVASTPCRSVHSLFEILGLDYKLIEIDFKTKEQKSEKIVSLNPRGKIPTINDDGFAMGESRAILQYLCNQYDTEGKLYPKEPKARARVDQMLMIDTDVMIALYKYVKSYQVLFLDEKPGLGDEDEMKESLRLLDGILEKSQYMAADHMTIADVASICTLSILNLCKYDGFRQFPHLNAWRTKMKSLPFYEKCVGVKAKAMTKVYQEKINT